MDVDADSALPPPPSTEEAPGDPSSLTCDICNKSFSNSYCLRRHYMTHDPGAKPYICSVCNKAFSEGCKLKSHMQKRHQTGGGDDGDAEDTQSQQFGGDVFDASSAGPSISDATQLPFHTNANATPAIPPGYDAQMAAHVSSLYASHLQNSFVNSAKDSTGGNYYGVPMMKTGRGRPRKESYPYQYPMATPTSSGKRGRGRARKNSQRSPSPSPTQRGRGRGRGWGRGRGHARKTSYTQFSPSRKHFQDAGTSPTRIEQQSSSTSNNRVSFGTNTDSNSTPAQGSTPTTITPTIVTSRLTCTTCNKVFSTPYALRRHEMMMHTGLRPFVCSVCQKGFIEQFKLTQHMQRHHRAPGQVFSSGQVGNIAGQGSVRFSSGLGPRGGRARNVARRGGRGRNTAQFGTNNAQFGGMPFQNTPPFLQGMPVPGTSQNLQFQNTEYPSMQGQNGTPFHGMPGQSGTEFHGIPPHNTPFEGMAHVPDMNYAEGGLQGQSGRPLIVIDASEFGEYEITDQGSSAVEAAVNEVADKAVSGDNDAKENAVDETETSQEANNSDDDDSNTTGDESEWDNVPISFGENLSQESDANAEAKPENSEPAKAEGHESECDDAPPISFGENTCEPETGKSEPKLENSKVTTTNEQSDNEKGDETPLAPGSGVFVESGEGHVGMLPFVSESIMTPQFNPEPIMTPQLPFGSFPAAMPEGYEQFDAHELLAGRVPTLGEHHPAAGVSQQGLEMHDSLNPAFAGEPSMGESNQTSEPVSLKCEFCSRVCSTPYGLRRHRMIHTGQKPYRCRHCNWAFSEACKLSHHSKRCLGALTAKIASGQRGGPSAIKTESGQDLGVGDEQSEMVKTSPDTPLVLKTVENVVSSKMEGIEEEPDIDLHTENKEMLHVARMDHEQPQRNAEGKLFCNLCGSTFTTPYSLRRHKLVHTGRKPFPCKLCTLAFRDSYKLKRHIKRFHPVAGGSKHGSARRKNSAEQQVDGGQLLQAREAWQAIPGPSAGFQQDLAFQAQHMGLYGQHVLEQSMEMGVDANFANNDMNADLENRFEWDPKKPFQCDICGKNFSSQYGLTRHRLIHSERKPYECENCGRGFTEPCRLKWHLTACTPEKPLALPKRSAKRSLSPAPQGVEPSQPLATFPAENSNDKGGKFTCEVCAKCFPNKYGLRRHYVVHSSTKPYVCRVCYSGYSEKFRLRFHLKVKHGIIAEDLDDEAENNTSLYEDERERGEGTKTRLRSSDNKPLVYMDNAESGADMEGEYSEGGTEVQGSQFPNLDGSLGEQNESKDNPSSCSVCHKTFSSAYSLRRHETIHTGNRPHVCAACGTGFTEPCRLRSHQMKCSKFLSSDERAKELSGELTLDKKVKCGVCSKVVASPYSLKRHMMLHDGRKPFVCDICHKDFDEACKLTTHVVRYHVNNPEMTRRRRSRSGDVNQSGASSASRKSNAGANVDESWSSQHALAQSLYFQPLNADVNVQTVNAQIQNAGFSPNGPLSPTLKRGPGRPRKNSVSPGVSDRTRRESAREDGRARRISGGSPRGRRKSSTSPRVDDSMVSPRGDSMASPSMVSPRGDGRQRRESGSPRGDKRRGSASPRGDSRKRRRSSGSSRASSVRGQATHLDQNGENPDADATPGGAHLACNLCDKSFSSPYALRRHNMLHNNTKPFKCNICDWSFSESCKLKRHLSKIHHITMEIHDLTVSGDLSPADLQAMNREDLQALNAPLGGAPLSALEDVEDVKKLQCEVCDKTLNSVYTLKRHMMIHTGQKPYQCQKCEKSFSENNKLKFHMKKYHRNSSRGSTGSVGGDADPGTSFSQNEAAQNVNITNSVDHHGATPHNSLTPNPKHGTERESSEENKCEVCSQSFASPYSLKRHKLSHTGKKPFTCSICNWGFLEPGRLRKHMKKSHPENAEEILNSPRVKISQPDSVMQQQKQSVYFPHAGVSPTGMRSMMSPPFLGQWPVDVNSASYGMVLNSDAKHHAGGNQGAVSQAQATGPSTCYCTLCGNSFSNSGDLARHMAVHNRHKCFACHVCKLTFKQAGDLQGHMLMHAVDVPCA